MIDFYEKITIFTNPITPGPLPTVGPPILPIFRLLGPPIPLPPGTLPDFRRTPRRFGDSHPPTPTYDLDPRSKSIFSFQDPLKSNIKKAFLIKICRKTSADYNFRIFLTNSTIKFIEIFLCTHYEPFLTLTQFHL